MKIPGLIALALLSSGCALFHGESSLSAVDAPPAAAPEKTAAREAFRPAYAAGRPIALVRCRKGAGLNDDCVAGETRHQVGDDEGVAGASSTVIEVALPQDPK